MCSFWRMIFSSYWADFSYFSSASGRTCQKLIFLKGGVHGFIYFSLIFFHYILFSNYTKMMYGNYPEIHNNDNKYSKHVIEGPGWLNELCTFVVGLPNNSYKRITILIPWISISWSQNKYNILSAASELDQLFLQYR
jgi:hypothetical protein